MAEQAESVADALSRLSDTLGVVPKVCILGGTSFNDPDSEAIVRSLAKELSGRLGDTAVLVTGGMAGVQKTFAEACLEGARLYNLLPFGQVSGFGAGRDIFAGRDLNERKEAFGLLGDVYITVEGGPGVAGEARAAVARGARVVPFVRTGGASGGMFDFPAEALQKPAESTEEQWDALTGKTAPASEAAAAAAALVENFVEVFRMQLSPTSNGDAQANPTIPRDIRRQFRFLRKKLRSALARQGDPNTEALAALGETTVAEQLANLRRTLLAASERKLQEESEDDAPAAPAAPAARSLFPPEVQADRAPYGDEDMIARITSEAEERIATSEENAKRLEDQVIEYEKMLGEMQEELAKLEKAKVHSQAVERAYVAQISQLNAQVQEAFQMLAESKEQCDYLQAEQVCAAEELARLADTAGVGDSESLRQAEEMAQGLLEKVQELEAQDRHQAKEIEYLQQCLAEVGGRSAPSSGPGTDQAGVDFEELAKDYETRLLQMEGCERALMSELDELQTQASKAQAEADSMRSRSQDLEAQETATRQEATRLQHLVVELERSMGEAQANLQRLEAKDRSTTDRQAGELQDRVAEYESEIRRLTALLAEAGDAASEKARREELERHNQKLEGIILDMRVAEQDNASKLEQLRCTSGESEALQAQLSEADYLVKETAARVEELQREVEEARLRAQNAEGHNYELQAEISGLRQVKQELEGGVQEYEQRNFELVSVIKSMAERETRLEQMEAALMSSRGDGSPTRTQSTSNLEAQLRDKESEIQALKQEVQQLNASQRNAGHYMLKSPSPPRVMPQAHQVYMVSGSSATVGAAPGPSNGSYTAAPFVRVAPGTRPPGSPSYPFQAPSSQTQLHQGGGSRHMGSVTLPASMVDPRSQRAMFVSDPRVAQQRVPMRGDGLAETMPGWR